VHLAALPVCPIVRRRAGPRPLAARTCALRRGRRRPAAAPAARPHRRAGVGASALPPRAAEIAAPPPRVRGRLGRGRSGGRVVRAGRCPEPRVLTASTPRSVRQLRPGDHVVVIGAGPAGLTAAYLLTKEGVRVTVLEGDTVVGGISRTARYKSYRFDLGGHRFFTKMTP